MAHWHGAAVFNARSPGYNRAMSQALTKRFTLNDLRAARRSGHKVAMLTCYDYLNAQLMQEAGVPLLLVGDSAANVILGYPTTLPISLHFLIEITSAVRRGAPNCLLIADMPFGSYQVSPQQGLRNALRMMKLSGCDCIKLEVAQGHAQQVQTLADAGVAVMAHVGLRPQAVGILGGYRYQGRTVDEAEQIVALARQMESAGAAALLLEAVPPEVGRAVVDATGIPVIGCGAGPACHGSVVVSQDLLGMTAHRPRFVPVLADMATPLRTAYGQYADQIVAGAYPAPEHQYEMPREEKEKFVGKSPAGHQ